ncbi:MAG: hypothetical protein ACOCXA_09475, partial [Planctomycetota bacterium]
MNHALVPAAPNHLRAWLIMLIVLGIAGLLSWRLEYVMIREHARFADLATGQQMRTWPIPAARGSILDRDGQPLAVSVRRWSLFADADYMDE